MDSISTFQDFSLKMAREQSFYDHSLRARLLGYDSYNLSRYLYHLRMIEWHEITPPHTHFEANC